jgi:hypothetical protein
MKLKVTAYTPLVVDKPLEITPPEITLTFTPQEFHDLQVWASISTTTVNQGISEIPRMTDRRTFNVYGLINQIRSMVVPGLPHPSRS